MTDEELEQGVRSVRAGWRLMDARYLVRLGSALFAESKYCEGSLVFAEAVKLHVAAALLLGGRDL